MRKHGATVDNLLSADVVTAQGEIVTASEEENPDLLGDPRRRRQLRHRHLVRVPTTPGRPDRPRGPVFHLIEDAPEVLRFYREFIAAAPDELTTIFELEMAPPVPFLPEEVHGKPILMVGACYAGSPDEGAEVVRPLKQFGRPIVDLLEPKPYTALQSMFDPSCRTAGTATGSRSSCRRLPMMRSRRSSSTRLSANLAQVLLHRPPARRGAGPRG